MQNSITLKEMEQLIANWRAQKKFRNEKMPATLYTSISQLLAKHPKSVVAKTLQLSKSTIHSLTKIKTKTSKHKKIKSPSDVNFIPFKLHEEALQQGQPMAADIAPQIICKINHPNGAELIINNGDINTIIYAFVCCK